MARFDQTMKRLVLTRMEIAGKTIKPVNFKGTVGKFVKEYNKGTYIVVIRGHAFTIKDAEVVGGNLRDALRLRCQVKAVWQV